MTLSLWRMETMMSLTAFMHIYSFEENEQILWAAHGSIASGCTGMLRS